MKLEAAFRASGLEKKAEGCYDKICALFSKQVGDSFLAEARDIVQRSIERKYVQSSRHFASTTHWIVPCCAPLSCWFMDLYHGLVLDPFVHVDVVFMDLYLIPLVHFDVVLKLGMSHFSLSLSPSLSPASLRYEKEKDVLSLLHEVLKGCTVIREMRSRGPTAMFTDKLITSEDAAHIIMEGS